MIINNILAGLSLELNVLFMGLNHCDGCVLMPAVNDTVEVQDLYQLTTCTLTYHVHTNCNVTIPHSY